LCKPFSPLTVSRSCSSGTLWEEWPVSLLTCSCNNLRVL
jgi:hypothetical protein